MIRVRAIVLALWYGVVPWWLYEEESHFAPMGYWSHLWLNMRYAWTWFVFEEDDLDRTFEREVNGH